MTELGLAACIAALAPVLVAIVNILGKRLERQVTPVPGAEADEVSRLRSAIRRHIVRCANPSDLINL